MAVARFELVFERLDAPEARPPGTRATLILMVRITAVAVSLVALACNQDKALDLCDRAAHHMAFGIIPPGESGQPSAEERKVMQVVVDMSAAKCRQEGLDAAQAECIFAYRLVRGGSMAQAMINLVECPAIAARRPSWLQMPPLEVLEEMRARERASDEPSQP